MSNYYYKKKKKRNIRPLLRLLSLSVFFVGMLGVAYVFFPLLSWQIFFANAVYGQQIAVPIPKTTVVSADTIQSLIAQASTPFSGVNYDNAQSWFPTYTTPDNTNTEGKTDFYEISIPKLHIDHAVVSTVDNNLNAHLVNYGGTAIPPQHGNAVIFGHSTLPQLFNAKNYRAIFATLYTIRIGDEISTKVNNVAYLYKVYSITIVDPSDTSVLAQNYDNSYVTLVTCTPPGTVWKRLVIKARAEKV